MSWLSVLDGHDDLISKQNQKQLRQWKRAHPGHRSFTVLRHPVARAHSVFCQRFLNTGDGSFLKIRDVLKRQFKVNLPKDGPGKNWTVDDHRAAFEGFLRFVKANLNGQTSTRVDAEWATQAQILAGFAELLPPDAILREDRLAHDLPALLSAAGIDSAPDLPPVQEDAPVALSQIYDPDLEKAVYDVYQRDYVMLGFDAWAL